MARRKKLENVLPVRKKAEPLPHRTATAGIIRNRRGDILIVQRPKKGLLGGLWKFPGGEKKTGESLKVCMMRSLTEDIGIEAAVREELISVDHGYSHFLITVHTFDCRLLKGKPRALGCADFRWVSPGEFSLLAFSKADREIMRVLR
jgi:A/G-specific adenine glycosylase